MKKIIIALALTIAVSVSAGIAQAEKVMSAELPGMTSSASVTIPEHFISFYLTATNFSKNDAVDKYETSYRPAIEFESDVLRKGDFSLVPSACYTAIGIDKDKSVC